MLHPLQKITTPFTLQTDQRMSRQDVQTDVQINVETDRQTDGKADK